MGEAANPVRRSTDAQLEYVWKTQENTKNYLTIKFHRPGHVIWTAPIDQHSWCKPGQPLFVVQLTDGTDVCVPVCVPQFDLRFPRETFWYVRKTCVQCWRNLENRITRNLLAQQKKNQESKRSSDNVGAVSAPADAGE